MPLNKRQFIAQTVYFFGCAGLGFFERYIFTGPADRGFVLYNIMKDVRKDLSRSDIEAVVERHYAPFLERDESNDTLVFSVW